MKSLLLFLVILPLVSRMLDGRYLLVDVNENVHQNLTAEGYTNHENAGCFGLRIKRDQWPAYYGDFYEAKTACDNNPKCGCFESPGCGSYKFYLHFGFQIKENGTLSCAWVKS